VDDRQLAEESPECGLSGRGEAEDNSRDDEDDNPDGNAAEPASVTRRPNDRIQDLSPSE
jgi:hypothetical protein